MKVLLSVALWGRPYAETFVWYGLASQLSAGNIPKLIEDHQVTYHVVTTHEDAAWMREQPNFDRLCKYCHVIWDFIEDVGFRLNYIPDSQDADKYPFMSRLQNIAFERSLEHDLLIFNYADFIWADGAIPGTVASIDDDVDAVLGFCPPVDNLEGKQALDELRAPGEEFGALVVPPRVSAGIVTDHLHDEARLRIWDGPEFTTTPTYVIWQVGTEGILVRVYHQTVLALRVKAEDPRYRAGIRRSSLDGYFSAELAKTGSFRIATNSDQVLVFSLYDAVSSTRLGARRSRESALKSCLSSFVSVGQRRFADTAIQVRRHFTDADLWAQVERRSQEILTRVHETLPNDSFAYELRVAREDVASLERGWRYGPTTTQRATKYLATSWMRYPGLVVLGGLRALFVGRLIRIYLEPRLSPSQQLWLRQVAAMAPRFHFTNVRHLAQRLSRFFFGWLRVTKGVRFAGRTIGLLRLRGLGD